MDDGLLCLEVKECLADSVRCISVNSATLSDRRGVNLPGAKVTLPAVSEKDKADIKFGIEQGVDVIFASFIRTADQVKEIKEFLKANGGEQVQVFSKIENQEGVDNFDAILKYTDGVMVARGDLGIEIPPQKVFSVQKDIIRKCNIAAKPVICATQMLESMVSNPRPTRAEVSDVGNAIQDGADCVMLSGETAKGKYPLNAVQVMADVAHEAESLAQNEAIWRYMKDSTPRPVTSTEAMASSAVALSFDDEFGMIVVISETGDTERFVAKYRPRIPVLIVTDQPYIYRQAVFRKGLRPMLVDSFGATLADKGASFMGDLKAMRRKSSMGGQQLKVNTVLQSACREGKELSLVKPGDKVIAIYDSDLSDGVEEATTLRVITVE